MSAKQSTTETAGEYECVGCGTQWQITMSNVSSGYDDWCPTCPVCGTDTDVRDTNNTESKTVNYSRNDGLELSYDVRDALDSYDRVEVWADEMNQLATAESKIDVYEPEAGRQVDIGDSHVSPQRAVELVFVNEGDD